VLDAARSDRRGVLGAEPTLDALAQDKVQMLLLAEAWAIAGSACARCDYFSAHEFRICPICGGAAERRDVAGRAVEKAIATGAHAELVGSENSRNRLIAQGGIGALLQY